MKKEVGEQHWTHGITCWKVWAQGFGSGWAGILRYGAMYWTPLIVYSIVNGSDEPGLPHTAAKSELRCCDRSSFARTSNLSFLQLLQKLTQWSDYRDLCN